MLQCPSSLKQMNFEMECFSSLQSYYKYRGDKLNHEIPEQWHLAPMLDMLVYDSIHP